ncbi:MAG: M48 family metalloprotease, partial [Desulfobacteraceae bacterium]
MEKSLVSGLLSRREFLRLTGIAGAGLAAGCAVNPVTGRSQLMLLSEKDEIRIDKTYSPHQFSADYGEFQDRRLQDYLERTGRTLEPRTHRPDMPYSFCCVNAPYMNAYAFPGGSIACTRGILVELGSEAELAGLLGHELGHVNARHTAQHMSKGMLASLAVSGLGMAVPGDGGGLGGLVSGLAGLGAGALLAAYSRDNEREADALGMEYMVRAGYSPVGMVRLMDMLRKSSERKPGALELMFSTHPMSEERYRTAEEAVAIKYRDARSLPVFRERFMD